MLGSKRSRQPHEVILESPQIRAGTAGGHVEVERLSKSYHSPQGDIEALRDITLSAARGEFVSILGASGCGKSTFLRLVAGLDEPTSGTVRIDGRACTGAPEGLGFVFQRDVLFDWRTILANILLPIEFAGLPVKQYVPRARELLATFGLEGFENRRPWELSGGMRQRTAICRALMNDPQLLLMDEPFGALDALTRDELNVELQRIWEKSQKTVLFVTHSIAEAVFLSDRVVVMKSRPGRIVEIVDIDFPRPRRLDLKEEREFGRYSRHLRSILEGVGAFRAGGN